MIIVIAGLKRSGSTWQFNVVRLYIELATATEPIITGSPDKAMAIELQSPDQYILCKYHPWHRKLNQRAKMVLSSNRKWADAMDSLERFQERPDKARQEAMKSWHKSWQKVADFYMEFSALKSDPDLMIHLIGLQLYENGVIPSFDIGLRDEVIKAMDNLEPPDEVKWYDSKTLLFHNHITDEDNRV